MAKVFNNEMSKHALLSYMGDIAQIADARISELKNGKSKGMCAIDVKTGTGFNFTILPDRGMDIAGAEYKGIPISFLSKTGLVSPVYSEENDISFFRSFYGGLLNTCGLTYMGEPCIDEGRSLGRHGIINNTPAEDVLLVKEWIGDEFHIRIIGKVRESRMMAENIILTREICTKLGESRICIVDKVENIGFEKQPFMMLYHCNFGYPIVSPQSILKIPEGFSMTKGDDINGQICDYDRFSEPMINDQDKVYYHEFEKYNLDQVTAGIFNKNINQSGVGAYIRYNKKQLPYLVQWKQMKAGDYLVSLEPSTWYVDGRAEAKKRGELKFIEPGEIKEYKLEIGIIDGENELQQFLP